MLLSNNKTLEQTSQRPVKRRRTDSPTGESEDSQMSETVETPGGTAVDMETAPATTKGSEERTSRFAIRKIIFKPKDVEAAQTNATTTPPPPIIVPHNGGKNHSKPVSTVDNTPKETATPVLLKAILNKEMNRGNYLIRNLNNATQIRATNIQTHKKIMELLTANKIQHYSYVNDGPRFKKFVLYGLNAEDIGDIKSDLCDYGLNPVDIKPMTIRKPRYHDHNNYIVYFDYDEKVTLQKIQQAKYICNTLVTWNHYKNPTNQCIQCQNCFRYNHNARECNMNAVCYLCAEDHKAETCPLMKQKQEVKADCIPQDCLKCVNCDGQHTAVFMNCPMRIKHLDKRRKNPEAPDQTAQQPKVSFIAADTPKQNYWEQNNRQHSNQHEPNNGKPYQQKQMTGPTPTRPGEREYYHSQRTPRSARTHTPNRRQSRSTADHQMRDKQQHYSHQSGADSINEFKQKPIFVATNNSFLSTLSQSNDTFTPTELAEIFQEMLGSISHCRNKVDQLNALMNLAIKYMPCRG